MRRLSLRVAVLAVAALAPVVAAAESYTLEEGASETRPFDVTIRLTVQGTMQTPTLDGPPASHDLDVVANHAWRERRLPGAGRDAAALRALREYRQANVKTQVGEHVTFGRLPRERSLLVAQGRREGVLVWSPGGISLMRGDIDLLQMPGDSLPVLGLLPPKKVEVGDTWTPESWVAQMLTVTEAVGKSSLECTLESVDDGVARITYEGSVDGATHGAATTLTLRGELNYDLRARHVASWTLTQKERRAIGAIDPGMDVEATVSARREVAADPGPLTDRALADVPLEPTPEQLRLMLDLPWGVRIDHDRGWHVFQMTDKLVVLRLMESGNFVGQCNITRMPSASPGKHLSEEQFQEEIRATLGERLVEMDEAEALPADEGRFVCRVRARGAVDERPYVWTYYLCAEKDGRQLAFVFTAEPDLLERLGDRDVTMVGSLREVSDGVTPVRPASAAPER